jgi:hypothetical protein
MEVGAVAIDGDVLSITGARLPSVPPDGSLPPGTGDRVGDSTGENVEDIHRNVGTPVEMGTDGATVCTSEGPGVGSDVALPPERDVVGAVVSESFSLKPDDVGAEVPIPIFVDGGPLDDGTAPSTTVGEALSELPVLVGGPFATVGAFVGELLGPDSSVFGALLSPESMSIAVGELLMPLSSETVEGK